MLAASGINNKIVFAGGQEDWILAAFNTVDIYNVTTTGWSVATLSIPRSKLAAAAAGTKILFSMRVFSNDRMLKDIDLQKIRSFSDIKTLIITGQQNRDEEIINLYHKLGLNISVTSFHKMTAEQIRISLNTPEDAYKLVVIIDEKEFDGFEAVKSIWNQGLADRVIIQMISSNDKKGNYLKSLTMGIDS